ncbi:MAG TPA: hypothetical protein VGB14_16245 [Acidimicrobiales bacterium]
MSRTPATREEGGPPVVNVPPVCPHCRQYANPGAERCYWCGGSLHVPTLADEVLRVALVLIIAGMIVAVLVAVALQTER